MWSGTATRSIFRRPGGSRTSGWIRGPGPGLSALQTEILGRLLATVSTPGCMGNVANWHQHILFRHRNQDTRLQNAPLVAESAEALRQALGKAFPGDASLARECKGPPRVFVPTVRGSLEEGLPLNITAIIMGMKPAEASLRWRPLGRNNEFKVKSLAHAGRGVYRTSLSSEGLSGDFEYHVRVVTETGKTFVWPPTAPDINQTVVRLDGQPRR